DEPCTETREISEQRYCRCPFLPAHLGEAQWHQDEEDEEHYRSAGREEKMDFVHRYATDDRGVEHVHCARVEEVTRLRLDMAQVLAQLATVGQVIGGRREVGRHLLREPGGIGAGVEHRGQEALGRVERILRQIQPV